MYINIKINICNVIFCRLQTQTVLRSEKILFLLDVPKELLGVSLHIPFNSLQHCLEHIIWGKPIEDNCLC